ncbi:hypothetical protein Tco_0381639 [Tanacetum coccineum]
MVLGIAPAAIIDRQLPFEYTITSRSTDVVVMALPSQNINHSAFRSMFKRENISGTNFNEWLHRLKMEQYMMLIMRWHVLCSGESNKKKQEAMSQQALQEVKEAKAARHKEALEAVRAETKRRNEESVLNKVQVSDIVKEFVVKVTDVGVDQAVMKMLTKKVGEAASAVKESVAQGLKQAFGGKDDN